MAIPTEEYLELSRQFRKLAHHCFMVSTISPEDRKLAKQPMNAFERNCDFLRSGIPLLVAEALEWAEATDWVDIVRDERGEPCNLRIIKPPF